MSEQIITAIATTGILGALTWIVRFFRKTFIVHEQSHKDLKEANLYQIKAQLLSMYKIFVSHEKKLTVYELEVFNDLYIVYKRLGGNSFMEDIKERVNSFEIVCEDI